MRKEGHSRRLAGALWEATQRSEPGQTDPSVLAPLASPLGLEEAPYAERQGPCCAVYFPSLLWAQQSGRETLICLGLQVCSLQNYKGQKHKSHLLRLGCKGAGSNRSYDLYFDNLSEIN